MATVTVLGRMRRFARLMTGHQRAGDDLIISLMGSSLNNWMGEPGTNDRVKQALSAVAGSLSDEFVFAGGVTQTRLAEMLHDELEELTVIERAAFVLSRIDGYDIEDIADIIRTDTPAAAEAAESADSIMFSNPRNVLVIESDDIIGPFVEVQLELLGLHVRVASSFVDELPEAANYDLLVVEPITADHDNITEMVSDFVRDTQQRVLWTTGSPDRIRGGGRDVGNILPKPFEVSDLIHEVQNELFVRPISWIEPDVSFTISDTQDVSDEALAPVSAPIDAEVVDEQLRIAPADAPDAVVPFSALDGVRRQHAEEARVLADEIRSSNGSRRVERKLEALAEILERSLTEDTVIALVVGIDGYARLLPTIQEEFMPLAAADMASFVYDIQGFTNQFPVARQFRAEAEAARPITADEEAALQSVVTVLLDQPDDIVAPAVKSQFLTLQSSRAVQAGSLVGDVGWLRSVSNSLKAVARYAKTFVRDVHSDARGKAVKGMSALIVALPVAYGLQLLSVSYPVEFAALTVLLSRSREQIKSTFDGGDDKKDGEK